MPVPDASVSYCLVPGLLLERRPHHDLLDPHPRRAVRHALALRRLALGVATDAELLPVLRAGDRVEVAPEVRRDRVVGDIGHRAHLLAVLDLPERAAAELAVVALLVDRITARS